MEIRSIQKLAWENKLTKGFNTSDVALEFCLLQGELPKPSMPGGANATTLAKNWPT